MFFCRTDGILKKRECVSKLKSAYYWFLLGTDYTENTDFTDFLYSFSVKSVFSVSKRNRQVYIDTSPSSCHE